MVLAVRTICAVYYYGGRVMEESNQDERPVDMRRGEKIPFGMRPEISDAIWQPGPDLMPFCGYYKWQKWHIRLFRWLFRRPKHKESEYVKSLLDYRKSRIDSTKWYDEYGLTNE